MRPTRASRRPRRGHPRVPLLARYLQPHWRGMLLLVAALFLSIAAQVAAPLLTARFLDRATSGAALSELSRLELLTMAVALCGQGVAVCETYLAESVGWSA